jgi:hypothetical protein
MEKITNKVTMIDGIEPILFGIFVLAVVWFFWIPQRYLLKNVRDWDFDFERDISYYANSLRSKWEKGIGKLAIIYCVLYIFMMIFKSG